MRLGLLLSLFLIGCANSTNTCGDKVLLVWPDANGAYSLQEVLIDTLPSPYEVKGPAAEVYYEPNFSDSGFEGRVAQPQLTNSGGVCVPTDTASSMSLAAYAIMERLQKFETRLGTAAQLRWPRKVGVDFHMNGNPIDTENNAHYFAGPDAMAVVPYTRANLPIALNHGILAHEHFHAHFQSQVNNPLNVDLPQVQTGDEIFPPRALSMKPTVDTYSGVDPTSPRTLNNYVLRAWNEGLADFFAGIFTGRANFFTDSLPSAARTRSLNLPLGPLATAADYKVRAKESMDNGMSSEGGMMPYAYGQGARIARLMYSLAQSGSIAPEAFLTHVMSRLGRLPPLLARSYFEAVLEPDAFLAPLIEGVPLNAQACANLNMTLGKNALVKGFGACAGF